jgi:hypothetical protein
VRAALPEICLRFSVSLILESDSHNTIFLHRL